MLIKSDPNWSLSIENQLRVFNIYIPVEKQAFDKTH